MKLLQKLSLILSLVLLSAPLYAVDPAIANLEVSQRPEFAPQKIQVHDFANGIRLYFLPNDELPLFQMTGYFFVGQIHDPDAKRGLLSATMSQMRSGGTKKLSPSELDDRLAFISAGVGGSSDTEFATVDMTCLAKDFTEVLDLYFDVLREPRFDEGRFQLMQQARLDGLKRVNEAAMAITHREFHQQLYGDKSVWARQLNEASVKALTREDLLAYHHKVIVPEKMWIAASGNIPFAQLVEAIENQSKDWQGRQMVLPVIPPVEKKWHKTIQFIDQPINQSSIVVGHFGDNRFNPDKYALILTDYILGGSTFSSRLGSRIRSTLGLAYSVGSQFGLMTDLGLFKVSVSTKSSSTKQVLEEVKNILKEMQTTKPITDAELAFAKNAILNTLIFQYENPFTLVTNQVIYDFYGYPPDYLQIFQKELEQVTLAHAQAVMKRYYFSDQLVMMVVGNKQEVGSLVSLGKVVDRPLDME